MAIRIACRAAWGEVSLRGGRGKSSILALLYSRVDTQTAGMTSGEMIIGPVVLEGAHVRLEPLSRGHHAGLCEIGLAEELWRWIPTPVRNPGRVIGSTRYMNIEKVHHRVEIGSTWIGREWQRTAVNTEAKYLLMRHAFETLGCMRVELKTDSLNEKSRAAILRIGAKEEGIFRNHMIMSSGRVRHTVYFSVVNSEWPEIRLRLERKLNR
jgi:RimJ/RimL family protein N-acetyltransferase